MESTLQIDGQMSLSTSRKKISYAKWGYFLIIPFFVVYAFFSLWPLLQTFFYSFFEYRKVQTQYVGPNFVGIDNYIQLFSDGEFFEYFGNTLLLWIFCFVPQIVVSLLLAVWFTDRRLRVRGQRFFKTVIYMPNLIMAAAFGALFLSFFGQIGPVNKILQSMGILKQAFDFTADPWATRIIIALMNFLMWFGNTTLLLMSGVMGIDEDIFEAATVDGAGAFRTFFDITMPLLKPIFVYVFITSLIGGMQLFDVADIFTKGSGGSNMTSNTIIMYLNNVVNRSGKNFGLGGAISVILFIITAALSIAVFFVSYKDSLPKKRKKVVKTQ